MTATTTKTPSLVGWTVNEACPYCKSTTRRNLLLHGEWYVGCDGCGLTEPEAQEISDRCAKELQKILSKRAR